MCRELRNEIRKKTYGDDSDFPVSLSVPFHLVRPVAMYVDGVRSSSIQTRRAECRNDCDHVRDSCFQLRPGNRTDRWRKVISDHVGLCCIPTPEMLLEVQTLKHIILHVSIFWSRRFKRIILHLVNYFANYCAIIINTNSGKIDWLKNIYFKVIFKDTRLFLNLYSVQIFSMYILKHYLIKVHFKKSEKKISVFISVIILRF